MNITWSFINIGNCCQVELDIMLRQEQIIPFNHDNGDDMCKLIIN